MTIRTRAELDEALLRVFVEALADEPFDEGTDRERAEPEEEAAMTDAPHAGHTRREPVGAGR